MGRFILSLTIFLISFCMDVKCFDYGRVLYPAEGNIEIEEGTIEFRLALLFDPEETFKDESQYRLNASLFYLEWPGEKRNGAIAISCYTNFTRGKYYCNLGISVANTKNELLPLGTVINDWKKGQWHHIAFTWKGKEMRLYIDGKEIKETRREQPEPFDGDIGKGKGIYLGDRFGNTGRVLFDDFRISSIARTEEEIKSYIKNEIKPDAYTLLLDNFNENFTPDGKTQTKCTVIQSKEGRIISQHCKFIKGIFGNCLSMTTDRNDIEFIEKDVEKEPK